MILTLKKGVDRKEIKLLEEKLAHRMQQKKSDKGFDAGKYNGVIKLKGDPLEIQRRLRDEWERDFG